MENISNVGMFSEGYKNEGTSFRVHQIDTFSIMNMINIEAYVLQKLELLKKQLKHLLLNIAPFSISTAWGFKRFSMGK